MFAWVRRLVSQTRVWLSPRQVDQDFDQELGAYLDLLTKKMPAEAYRQKKPSVQVGSGWEGAQS